MENLRNSNNKSSKRKGNFSKFAPILASALFLASPNLADAQSISTQNRNNAEVSTSTILDRLNKKIGVSLPNEYNQKVLDFVLNDTIMRTKSATAYTEEFIINEMKKDRGINKQNQLLFIRSKIYGGISQKKLYNRLDDDNETRFNEYKQSLKQIANCYEEYKKGFKTYMETKSAEARQQSAEARQQSAEADNENLRLDSLGIEHMIEFYNIYIRSPNTVKQDEISFMKKSTQEVIIDCKKRGIDYRAILLKEVGDKRKVEEMLKFYGVE